MNRELLKWNGWGYKGTTYPIANHPKFITFLKNNLRIKKFNSTPSVHWRDINVTPSAFETSPFKKNIQFSTSPHDRLFHSRGRSYLDLISLRENRVTCFPDAVVYPKSSNDVLTIIKICNNEGIKIIPFGGGSSVVGGVSVQRTKSSPPILTVDLSYLNKITEIDHESMLIQTQTGIYGPKLEKHINKQGLTLGHFPQSFEFSTVGGWIGARSAGQQSNKYHKIESMLKGFNLITPTGTINQSPLPAHSTGPDLNHIISGSEGTFGIITDAWLQVHPLPHQKKYAGVLFKDFESGTLAIRSMVQQGFDFATIRLSDIQESSVLSALSSKSNAVTKKILSTYLKYKGFSDSKCLAIIGFEGHHDIVNANFNALKLFLSKNRHLFLGEHAAEGWYKSRFALPYLRDYLMDNGLFIETFETATSWSQINQTYYSIKDTIKDVFLFQHLPYIILCHISHVYQTGASLYFTCIAPKLESDPIGQWNQFKENTLRTISEQGAALSHHHGIGSDHINYLHIEKSPHGMSLLRAMKNQLDPNNIMNPGKLFK